MEDADWIWKLPKVAMPATTFSERRRELSMRAPAASSCALHRLPGPVRGPFVPAKRFVVKHSVRWAGGFLENRQNPKRPTSPDRRSLSRQPKRIIFLWDHPLLSVYLYVFYPVFTCKYATYIYDIQFSCTLLPPGVWLTFDLFNDLSTLTRCFLVLLHRSWVSRCHPMYRPTASLFLIICLVPRVVGYVHCWKNRRTSATGRVDRSAGRRAAWKIILWVLYTLHQFQLLKLYAKVVFLLRVSDNN